MRTCAAIDYSLRLFLKEIRELQEMLDPHANFHKTQDLPRLKAQATTVVSLLRSLPCAQELMDDQELKDDIDIIVKGCQLDVSEIAET